LVKAYEDSLKSSGDTSDGNPDVKLNPALASDDLHYTVGIDRSGPTYEGIYNSAYG